MPESRQDRNTIDQFAAFYSKRIGHEAKLVSYPEADPATPKDARIDAIYTVGKAVMHVEHTSIDLIRSGERTKRDLDPGFIALEKQLEKLSVPPGRGVSVYIPLNVEGPKALKQRGADLVSHIRKFITEGDAKEWNDYRATHHEFDCDGVTFRVRANRGNDKIMPGWWGDDRNFLNAKQVRETLQYKLPSKISKLDASTCQSTGTAFSVLLIETNDVAAKGFLDWSGEFARVIASQNTTLSEVWGISSGVDPFLIWSDTLDKGRLDSAYQDDPQTRFAITILQERLWNWQHSRTATLD